MSPLYPILEFDPDPKAIIDPSNCYPKEKLTQKVIIVFFQELINKLLETEQITQVAQDVSEMGFHRFYSMNAPYSSISLFHPGLGGPLAASLLEAAIAMGGKNFVAIGSAGLLGDEVHDHLIVPTEAIRDEGTSYHYLPPDAKAVPSSSLFSHIVDYLRSSHIPFQTGKTWTTDAFFRETRQKVATRKTQGCLTVEMESASFFAVAQFRKVQLAQLLYISDAVSENGWGGIQKKHLTREELFWHAVAILQNFNLTKFHLIDLDHSEI